MGSFFWAGRKLGAEAPALTSQPVHVEEQRFSAGDPMTFKTLTVANVAAPAPAGVRTGTPKTKRTKKIR
jgi:hypothetical protein